MPFCRHLKEVSKLHLASCQTTSLDFLLLSFSCAFHLSDFQQTHESNKLSKARDIEILPSKPLQYWNDNVSLKVSCGLAYSLTGHTHDDRLKGLARR